MSFTSSILSLIFIACIMHTIFLNKHGFKMKWELLRYYFLIGMPVYLLFWDMHLYIKVAVLTVMLSNLIRVVLKTDKRFSLLLNLINVVAIIITINMLKEVIETSQGTYIGLTFCFGAFFTSFFDSVLIFKEYPRLRIVFLGIGHLFMFHVIWAVFEMGI